MTAPETHRFNGLVERFDFLTLFTRDQDTPDEILSWYRLHDAPIVAEEFEAVARQLGYFDGHTTKTP